MTKRRKSSVLLGLSFFKENFLDTIENAIAIIKNQNTVKDQKADNFIKAFPTSLFSKYLSQLKFYKRNYSLVKKR
jgi:hypothetical protein